MSRSLSRAVLLLGAITLPISGRLCGQVAKVALGTEPSRFRVGVYNDEVVPDPNPTIRVGVVDSTSVSPAILGEAEHEAGRILSKAGLRTVWVNCSRGHSTPGPQDPCQKLEATDIWLRLLSEPTQNELQDTVFGFAVVPVVATVYYEAVRHAKSDGTEFDIPIILGCVIVHEIGHLLLGSNSHSSSGVMKPRWERKQFRQAMTGILLFTPQQAKHIQAEAQTRMRVQTARIKERAQSERYYVAGPKDYCPE
jgi:hypothetical protein